MNKSIAVAEFKTVSSGIRATDMMLKTANVEIVETQTVCPGKYITILSGLLSAITAAIDTVKAHFGEKLIGSFILGNPHDSILPAIYGTTNVEKIHALGILETYDVVSAITAADFAVKTAIVDLIELRVAKGMCGKSYMLLTGEISSVDAAIEKARSVAAEAGMYLDSSVIANPDANLSKYIL